MFQFHYGTIGSIMNSKNLIIVDMEFQFHYGTIGSRFQWQKQMQLQLVSIPLWYDW